MSKEQKALLLPGHPGEFVVGNVPIYAPGPEQLLIKIHSTALNPADWKVQQSGSVVSKFPAILGFDRAGEIVQVGEGVSGFVEGDRVVTASAFIVNELQGFQQYALADTAFTSKIPPNITYDQAATLPIGLVTAYSGWFAEFPRGAGLEIPKSQTYSGKSVLILGGASSVGQFAIQLAKLAGFSTIITTASLKNESLLLGFGATHVFDRSLDGPALVSAISSITSNSIDLVYDTIALPPTEKLALAVLSHHHSGTGQKGILVSSKPQPSEGVKNHPSIKPANVYAATDVPWNQKLFQTMYHEYLFEWLESGVIKPNRLEVLSGGLAAIPEGLNRLQNNQISGLKLVVRPHETA